MSCHFEQHDFVSPTQRCVPLWVHRKTLKKSVHVIYTDYGKHTPNLNGFEIMS